MDKSNTNVRLSRRKLLGGIGAVGVASAGAGLGTTAYFSDDASFENNEIDAGRLELTVSYAFAADQDIRDDFNPYAGENGGGGAFGSISSTPDTPGSASYQLDDVKPGDSGRLGFSFFLDDNPGYVWACGRLTENAQNGVTDPERTALLDAGLTNTEIDASETDPWGGQLADAIEAELVYQQGLFNGTGNSQSAPIVSGSLRDVLAALTNGIPLDENRNPEAGLDRSCFPAGSTTTTLALLWSIPAGEVGNEIQTDSIGFDLTFHVEQCRHNDGETTPCVEASVGEGYGADRLARDPVWFARARNGSGPVGDQLLVGNAPANTGDYDSAGISWTDPTTAELTVAHDATAGGLTIAVENGVSGAITYSGALANPSVQGGTNAILITAKSSNDTEASVSDVRLNGAAMSGADAATASDGSPTFAHLLIEGLDATADWTLTGELTLVGAGSGGPQERPAVDINIA